MTAEVLPSIVCEAVVAIVVVPHVFFTEYLFVFPTAVGRVRVSVAVQIYT